MREAAAALDVPIALISLVDEDRQWFKARVGISASETPRPISFCTHAIRGDDVLVVEDARTDPLFAANPLVTGPTGIRFYAGVPLRTVSGQRIGTLCVLDRRPRYDMGDYECAQLELLAARTMRALDARRRRLAARY